MTPDAYNNFTKALEQNLINHRHVIGLIALGSMAAQDYLPDQWSDHDFFVVVEFGKQELFHTDLSWLPHNHDIVLHFRETPHGDKVLYANGHLLEYAIFDLEELSMARVNRYRVLVNKADLSHRVATIQNASDQARQHEIADDTSIFGQFLINLHVGIGRYHRGEVLTAHQFVKMYALTHLLTLLHKHMPATQKALLDNLDVSRRFEKVFPELGQTLNRLLLAPIPQAAQQLLALADNTLHAYLPNYPETAVAVVRRYLQQRP